MQLAARVVDAGRCMAGAWSKVAVDGHMVVWVQWKQRDGARELAMVERFG